MKRKHIIILITTLGAICVALIIFMVAVMTGALNMNQLSISDGALDLANRMEISADQANQIDIAYSSDSITFYEGDSEDLVVEEYMNRWDESMLATVTRTDDRISVNSGERPNSNFIGGLRSNIKVYLPKSYHGSLETSVSSGSLRSDQMFTLDSVKLESNSGSIQMKGFNAKNGVTCSVSSGSLTIERIETLGTCSLTANSGDIDADNILAADIKVSASSGSINLDEAHAETMTGKVNSGSLSVNLEAIKSNVNLETTSGNIKLALPDSLGFTLNINTNSGDIRTDFDDQLAFNKEGTSATGQIGNGSSVIDLSATSGNITVEQ